jgi:hypothetical protein
LVHAVPKYKGVLGPTQHLSGSSCALLTIFDAPPTPFLQLLPVSHDEDHPEEEKISRYRRHTTGCNLLPACHSKTGPKNMLKNERIAGITVYSLEEHTLKVITRRYLRVL